MQHPAFTNKPSSSGNSRGCGSSRYSPYGASPKSSGLYSQPSWKSSSGFTPYQYPSAIPDPLKRKGYSKPRGTNKNINPPRDNYSRPPWNNNISSIYRSSNRTRGRPHRCSKSNRNHINGSKNKGESGPPDYRKYVRTDMVGDPWAHFPSISNQNELSSSAATNSSKSTTTHELPGKSMPLTRDSVNKMKAHPDRQQRINDYEASDAAPKINSGLEKSNTTSGEEKMEPGGTTVSTEALSTNSRLSSDKNPVDGNMSMADILSEFL